MATSERLSVALIGHGLSGAYLHGPLIEAVPALRIELVCTARPATLSLRREPVRVVADAVQACCDPAVQLVVLATPNRTHFELARAALSAGKHVVVDKPFALSVAEVDELIALADERQRLLTVFHNRRLDGDFLEVQRRLQQGILGTPQRFEASWDRFRPQIASGWRQSDAHGAGLLWDLGPHLIDQALCLFGPPQRWQAEIAVQRAGARADDYFALTLWYGSLRCVVSASMLMVQARPRFAVHGSRGSFLTFGIDSYEAALRAGARPDAPGFRAQLTPTPALSVIDGTRHEDSIAAGHWERFYPDVLAAILEQRTPAVSAQQARGVVALIEQAHAHGANPL